MESSPEADDGRGRTATSPGEIPARGARILKRSFKQLKADNIPTVAAGLAFYIFLALVPAPRSGLCKP